MILLLVGERVYKMKIKLKSNSNPEINNHLEHLTRLIYIFFTNFLMQFLNRIYLFLVQATYL